MPDRNHELLAADRAARLADYDAGIARIVRDSDTKARERHARESAL